MNDDTKTDDMTNLEPTMEEFETMCREPAERNMREKEAEWIQKGFCFSWIDPEPTWATVAEWSMLYNANADIAFPDPDAPCIRILRFSLLGGGQIRAIEDFHAIPASWNCGSVSNGNRVKLKVTAHVGDSIVQAIGNKYEGEHWEMNAQAVVLYGKHQDIADRAAATFRLIDGEADNFFALLDGSEGCAICGKPLRDEISKLISVGPCCAKKYGVPHSRQAAEKRLELRKKLLGVDLCSN